MRSQFTPRKIENDYWVFALQLPQCPICERYMIATNLPFFPHYVYCNQAIQMEAAGIVEKSQAYQDDAPICVECAKAGKASFTCEFCGELRSSALLLPDSYAPRVCQVCYETLTKKEWDEKQAQYEEQHRYDYD